ncbi:MAG: hypothetical protein ISS23_02600 [Nanoarchaeota archaeon]|nr:hypothetical protein [Nanoarchaeota archaeon]
MQFKEIKPTKHYLEYHSNIPWYKVVEIILTSKDKRKKGNKIMIKKDNYYILCQLKNKILYVINAK